MAILQSALELQKPYANSRNHWEDCRFRIDDLLGKDEEERDNIQHAKERIDEHVAKQGEEHIYHKQEGDSY